MKAGFIAVVGRPNVGKSTLINKLVSEKVAIVSDKAGTTRDTIKGILNVNGNQYVFIDTPGIHKPKHLLGEYMTNSAVKILKDVDLILMILDGTQEISTGDEFVMERVMEARRTPRILVINKIDKLTYLLDNIEFPLLRKDQQHLKVLQDQFRILLQSQLFHQTYQVFPQLLFFFL